MTQHDHNPGLCYNYELYELLESTIMEVPKKDILIIQGDWNAKVGPDAYENWAGTVGRFGIGETSDRGLRLLDFARSHCLTLTNTLHPHKLSQTATWHSNNSQVHNQIVFILALQCLKFSINKAKWGHSLVLTSAAIMTSWWQPSNWSWKPSIVLKNPAFFFDLDKLKDPEVATVSQAQVGGKFTALNLIDSNVETLAGDIKEVLLTTAEEVLGKKMEENAAVDHEWSTGFMWQEERAKRKEALKWWSLGMISNCAQTDQEEDLNSQKGVDRGTVQHHWERHVNRWQQNCLQYSQIPQQNQPIKNSYHKWPWWQVTYRQQENPKEVDWIL